MQFLAPQTNGSENVCAPHAAGCICLRAKMAFRYMRSSES